MLILGLTGGIATGKSTVSKYLEEKYKIPIIDADKIAREIVEPGTPCFTAIVKHFSPNIPELVTYDVKGKPSPLNRAALGAYVFANKEELKVLNSITHPAVRKRLLYMIFCEYLKRSPVVILDIPLMFESGMDWLCSRVLTVVCDGEHQMERLLKRNKELSREEAHNRINSQMPLNKKVVLSDYVIDNNSDLVSLERCVDDFVTRSLPALRVNRDFNYYRYLVASWWNFLQFLFPPFAFGGGLYVVARKAFMKVVTN
jgi:dephospho-CoA kinase